MSESTCIYCNATTSEPHASNCPSAPQGDRAEAGVVEGSRTQGIDPEQVARTNEQATRDKENRR